MGKITKRSSLGSRRGSTTVAGTASTTLVVSGRATPASSTFPTETLRSFFTDALAFCDVERDVGASTGATIVLSIRNVL